MVKSIAIVGGSSDIAKSTISSMSADNYKFHVLVRDDSHTDEWSASGVSVVLGDATSEEDIKNFISGVKESGEIHAILHCVGSVSYTHLTLPTKA